MQKIKVIICEPNEPPRIEQVPNTLETWQDLVGGFIDIIHPHADDTCIILNDEGKIYNLPMNRTITDETGAAVDVICGTFIILGDNGEDFRSLTDEETDTYMEKYAEPIKDDESAILRPLSEPRIYVTPFPRP